MRLIFKNTQTNGALILSANENVGEKYFFEESSVQFFHTIAWNRGEAQKITIDEIEYIFEKNTIIPLMLNQSYKFNQPENIISWQFNREFYCIVNHDQQVGCVGFLFFGPEQIMFISLEEIHSQQLEATLKNFENEFQTKDETQEEMLRVLLVGLIIQLTRIAKKKYLNSNNNDTSHYHTIREFSLLVEHNFRNEHQVKFYAEKLNKSAKTLANLFSNQKLKSPSEIIQERIITEAKRLFHYTNKSVKEISAELGFEDSAHFSKFFKNYTTFSPSEFKQMSKNFELKI